MQAVVLAKIYRYYEHDIIKFSTKFAYFSNICHSKKDIGLFFLGGGGMIVVVIFRIIKHSVVVYIYRDKRTGIVLQNNCIVHVYMTSYDLRTYLYFIKYHNTLGIVCRRNDK